jgi:glycosyltransferase involved in cell wall biosynthesis
MPLVSVIMTSYNYGRYISEAIESVLNQTLADLELIVIDDASSDDSAGIIERYGKTDPRVRPIYHLQNKGIARTLNEGIEAASGKFIAFIASDDSWATDKLEKQVDVLEKDEDLVVWSEGEIMDKNGRPLRNRAPGDLWRGSRLEKLTGIFRRGEDLISWSELETLDGDDWHGGLTFTGLFRATGKKKSGGLFNELLQGNYILGSSLLFKKDILGDIRFNPDLKYLNDFLFILELAKKYPLYFIDEPLIRYRLHGKNSTLRDNRGWDVDILKTNTLLLNRYGPDIPRSLKSKLFCDAALIYAKMGKPGNALRHLYHGVILCPPHAYYALTLGYLMLKSAFQRDYYQAERKASAA